MSKILVLLAFSGLEMFALHDMF